MTRGPAETSADTSPTAGSSGTPGEHEFRTVSSRTVTHGAITALRLDEVAMPGGVVAEREVVEHHSAVAVVALDEEGRVALVRQYRHAVETRLWELPAGILDIPGEDPAAAAARELQEEAGLTAARWHTLVDLVSSPGFSDETVRVFLARGLGHTARSEVELEEADLRLEMWPLDDAVAAALAGHITNGIAVAGLLAAHHVLGGSAAVQEVLRPADAPWELRAHRFAERGGMRRPVWVTGVSEDGSRSDL